MFYHLNNHLEIFSDVPEYDFHYHLYPVLIYNLQLPSISKTFLFTQDRTNPLSLYHTTRFVISTSNLNVTGLISTFDKKTNSH